MHLVSAHIWQLLNMFLMATFYLKKCGKGALEIVILFFLIQDCCVFRANSTSYLVLGLAHLVLCGKIDPQL